MEPDSFPAHPVTNSCRDFLCGQHEQSSNDPGGTQYQCGSRECHVWLSSRYRSQCLSSLLELRNHNLVFARAQPELQRTASHCKTVDGEDQLLDRIYFQQDAWCRW